jgi:hypothetical protein
LGGGGFGEVWHAETPGNFAVAIKFVRLGRRAAVGEARSLELFRSVRHPNLLPIFAAWPKGDFLVIVMELADGTLLDRLEQAREQGHAGIPRPELAEYLREAARGLDFLNEPRHRVGDRENVGIQHRDVKPQNLLLVGDGVKVADFGLARLMEHSVTGHSGGMTPAYAPPEFFSGTSARQSDQYSLAVTWCHLVADRLPFSGSHFQIMSGHLHGEPDLAMLPDGERAVVHRALHKDPRERWSDCRAFAAALRDCQAGAVVPTTVVPVRPLTSETLLAPAPTPLAIDPGAATRSHPGATRDTAEAPAPTPATPSATPAERAAVWSRRRRLGLAGALGMLASVAGLIVLVVLTGERRSNTFDSVSDRLGTMKAPGGPGLALVEVSPQAAMPAAGVAVGTEGEVLFADDQGRLTRWRPGGGWEALGTPGFAPVGMAVVPGGGRWLVFGRPWLAGIDPAGAVVTDLSDTGVVFAGHAGPVWAAAVSPDGKQVASGGEDGRVRVWDAVSGVEVWNSEPAGPVHAVGWSPAGDLVAWGCQDGSVHVQAPGRPGEMRLLGRHAAPFGAIAFLAGGRVVSAARSGVADELDDGMLVWDLNAPAGKPARLCAGRTIAALARVGVGSRVVVGGDAGGLEVWDAPTGTCLATVASEPVVAVATQPDGRRTVSLGRSGAVTTWVLAE